ncbi:MAG: DsbA family protein [Methylococcaceae bacterium]
MTFNIRKIFVLFCTILTACAADTRQLENWEANELFTQLSELRKEIKILKGDVKSLKQNAPTKKNTKGNKKAIEIDLSHSFPLGKSGAKYAIVEYTDYQCPYCLKHRKKTFPIIKQQYIDPGVIKYFVKDYPLDFHGQAKNAAISSQCAGQQGKFWAMHQLIFENNRKLSKEVFSSFAGQIAINVTRFNKCLNSSEAKQIVENNILDGELIGVQGTPAFFIGRLKDDKLVDGRALYGAQSFSAFSKVVNALIKQ